MPHRPSEEVGRARQREQFEQSESRLLGGTDDMDQDARDDAAAAMNKIKSHEELCEERWDNANKTSVRIETALASMQKGIDERVGKVPASIIAAMAAVIGFLADRAFPLH